MFDEESRGDVIKAVEPRPELGWADLLGKRGGTTDVGEQEARLDLGATVHLRQDAEAVAAVFGVLRPAVPAEDTHERVADASEGRRTHLATWLARQVLETRPSPRHPRVRAEQEGAPGRFVLARTGRGWIEHQAPAYRCRIRVRRADRHVAWGLTNILLEGR